MASPNTPNSLAKKPLFKKKKKKIYFTFLFIILFASIYIEELYYFVFTNSKSSKYFSPLNKSNTFIGLMDFFYNLRFKALKNRIKGAY